MIQDKSIQKKNKFIAFFQLLWKRARDIWDNYKIYLIGASFNNLCFKWYALLIFTLYSQCKRRGKNYNCNTKWGLDLNSMSKKEHSLKSPKIKIP